MERGEIASADELRDEILSVAGKVGDVGYVLAAGVAACTTLWLGRIIESCAYAKKAVIDYERFDEWLLRPDLLGLHFAALARWILGFPDRALAHAEDALARAHNLDPINRANGLRAVAEVCGLRGELVRADEVARELVEVCTQYGIGGMMGVGTRGAIATLGMGAHNARRVRGRIGRVASSDRHGRPERAKGITARLLRSHRIGMRRFGRCRFRVGRDHESIAASKRDRRTSMGRRARADPRRLGA
jgi:hypothetical protein